LLLFELLGSFKFMIHFIEIHEHVLVFLNFLFNLLYNILNFAEILLLIQNACPNVVHSCSVLFIKELKRLYLVSILECN